MKRSAPKHLDFIRSLWCWRCGNTYEVEAAHIRFASALYAKPITGMGIRPPDHYAIPLCRNCHLDGADAQHKGNEREWWEGLDINPLLDALLLFVNSGDRTAAKFLYSTKCARLHARPL